MRNFIRLSGIALVLLSACASISPPSRDVSFEKVTTISFDESTADQLTTIFGPPQAIIPLPNESAQLWTYREERPGIGVIDRANFWVELPSRKIMTATWFPRPNEKLASIKDVLGYFPKKKFSAQDEGLVAHDAYSRDQIYSSEDGMVSATEHFVSKTVSSISLSSSPKRSLSSKEKLNSSGQK